MSSFTDANMTDHQGLPSKNANENDDITCQDSVSMVSLHRDGEISQADQQKMNQHIATCSHCQVAHAQFQALFSSLDMLLVRDHQL
jgi:anti-sigma factor RsiW